MTNTNLKIRVAGETASTEVDYPLDIVRDFHEDFERFGHISGDTLIIADAHAKTSFVEWCAFHDCLTKLIDEYVRSGLIAEEELDAIYNDEFYSRAVPDQDIVLYKNLMKLINNF